MSKIRKQLVSTLCAITMLAGTTQFPAAADEIIPPVGDNYEGIYDTPIIYSSYKIEEEKIQEVQKENVAEIHIELGKKNAELDENPEDNETLYPLEVIEPMMEEAEVIEEKEGEEEEKIDKEIKIEDEIEINREYEIEIKSNYIAKLIITEDIEIELIIKGKKSVWASIEEKGIYDEGIIDKKYYTANEGNEIVIKEKCVAGTYILQIGTDEDDTYVHVSITGIKNRTTDENMDLLKDENKKIEIDSNYKEQNKEKEEQEENQEKNNRQFEADDNEGVNNDNENKEKVVEPSVRPDENKIEEETNDRENERQEDERQNTKGQEENKEFIENMGNEDTDTNEKREITEVEIIPVSDDNNQNTEEKINMEERGNAGTRVKDEQSYGEKADQQLLNKLNEEIEKTGSKDEKQEETHEEKELKSIIEETNKNEPKEENQNIETEVDNASNLKEKMKEYANNDSTENESSDGGGEIDKEKNQQVKKKEKQEETERVEKNEEIDREEDNNSEEVEDNTSGDGVKIVESEEAVKDLKIEDKENNINNINDINEVKEIELDKAEKPEEENEEIAKEDIDNRDEEKEEETGITEGPEKVEDVKDTAESETVDENKEEKSPEEKEKTTYAVLESSRAKVVSYVTELPEEAELYYKGIDKTRLMSLVNQYIDSSSGQETNNDDEENKKETQIEIKSLKSIEPLITEAEDERDPIETEDKPTKGTGVEFNQNIEVKQVAGKEKHGMATGYFGFDIGIELPEDAILADGLYAVTVYPENTESILTLVPAGAMLQRVNYVIYHLHDDVEKKNLDESQIILNENQEIVELTFTTENFSDFILQYTVEFTYTEPVTQYTCPEYTLPGNSSVMLSQILWAFGLNIDLNNAQVIFSNTDLISIEEVVNEKSETDFIVTSLQAFTTTEMLTIILENDDRIVLKVTDSAITGRLLDFKAKFKKGAVLNNKNDLVWAAEEKAAGHGFIYRVTYNVTNTKPWEAGEIKITIPKSILHDDTGDYADIYDIALPSEDEQDLDETNIFVYKEEGDNIIVFNRISAEPSQAGYFEIMYSTTEETWDYVDYGSDKGVNAKGASDEFIAEIELRQEDNVIITDRKTADPVYIDTSAQLIKLTKGYPTAYTSWNPGWGIAKPADADEYTYLIWPLTTIIQATQKYDLKLADIFDVNTGEVVGYRLHGQEAFTEGTTITISELSESYVAYGRTDTVLTRQKKSVIEAELETRTQYTVNNNASATLHPVGGVEADTTANSSNSYQYEKKEFQAPGGSFWSEKYGYSYSGIRYNNDYYAYPINYQLNEFISGEISKIEDLRWQTYMYGYTYPYTLGSGASRLNPENYGKNPVTFELRDNELYARAIDGTYGSEKLTKDDYQIDKLTVTYSANDAEYNEDEMKFETKLANNTSDVIEVYVENQGAGGYVHVASLYPGNKTSANINTTYINTISGFTITFKDGITGFMLRTTNKHYYTYMSAYPYITLKRSQDMVNLASSTDKLKIDIRNVSNASFYRGTIDTISDSTEILTLNRYSSDFVLGIVRKGYMEKSVLGFKNNARSKQTAVTWTVTAGERYEMNGNYEYIEQSGGIFYDLMPKGSDIDISSVSVLAESKVLSKGQYSIKLIQNYKESGQHLLIIRIDEPTSQEYRITYKTIHTWDTIKDNGTYLLNTVAYETGNDKIGDGYPDNGGNLTINKSIMTGLDEEYDASQNRFIYREHNYEVNTITASTIGLYKKVKAETDETYTTIATTYPDSVYSYKIRFSTSDESKATNMVLYDSIENYTITKGANAGTTSDWHGILESIDVTQLVRIGIAPVIYYSTIANLDIGTHTNIDDNLTWVKASDFRGEMKDVKAIAVDMRKASDGSDYEMQEDQSGTVILYMRSPKAEEISTTSTNAIALNNIYMYCDLIDMETGMTTSELMNQDYTTVKYRVKGEINLIKVDAKTTAEGTYTIYVSDTGIETGYHSLLSGMKFRLWGTSDYGTQVDVTVTSTSKGRVKFSDLERGTYSLQEIEGTKDYFLDENIHTVIINNTGVTSLDGVIATDNPLPSGEAFTVQKITEAGEERFYYIFMNDPRIHGELRYVKRGRVDGSLVTRNIEGVLYELSGTSDYGNDIVQYATSESSGIVKFTDVEMGTYVLKEQETVDGYILSPIEYKVVCDSDGIVMLYAPAED